MKEIKLDCKVCGKALSLFFEDDKVGDKGGQTAALGCMCNMQYPVISHTDYNKIFQKFLELRVEGKA